MANALTHAAQRKVFEVAMDNLAKKFDKGEKDALVDLVDTMQKYGKVWDDRAYESLKQGFAADSKWGERIYEIYQHADKKYLHDLFMSAAFEGGFYGFQETRRTAKKYGCGIPWIILFDPTTACNLKCVGCWAAEYSKQLNLSHEDMDSIVTQAKDLGIHEFVMTGGEPTVRKADVFKLCEKHKDCGFWIFTNGTMVDQAFVDNMKKCGNIMLNISIEGDEATTDARRGKGTYQRAMKAMDTLKENGIIYGTSICYTSQNYKAVTTDEFYDFLLDKGVVFSWYFHFMPVGNATNMDLVPTPEQREYMYHRVREVRGYHGGKPIYLMDFQNDGEFVSGCIAGGKYYCHINSRGDVEPCVFIHYSSANIHEKSLLECLQQPLFKAYQKAQPFNKNLLQPCPMLENPKILRGLVEKSGAKSTDMMDPENVEHLCGKCDPYADAWAPVADRLWKSNHPNAS